jgi:hypothetical protein
MRKLIRHALVIILLKFLYGIIRLLFGDFKQILGELLPFNLLVCLNLRRFWYFIPYFCIGFRKKARILLKFNSFFVFVFFFESVYVLFFYLFFFLIENLLIFWFWFFFLFYNICCCIFLLNLYELGFYDF